MTAARGNTTKNAADVDRMIAAAGKPVAAPVHSGAERPSTRLFGLPFDDRPLEAVAASLVDDALAGRRRPVFFVNAHCVNVAARDPEYANILGTAPALYADGVGMAIAGKIMNAPIRNNVNGTDLLPKLCDAAARQKVPLALLGGKPGVAARCARALESAYPGLEIAWHEHGYLSEDEEQSRLDELNAGDARILLVAKGVPLQEKWIHRHAGAVRAPVILGVGALFDFYSGNVARAPYWVRRLRSEWLFRLAIEPGRMFGRYVLGNPAFLARVLSWRLGARTPWASLRTTRQDRT